jgi:hypothetical protein
MLTHRRLPERPHRRSQRGEGGRRRGRQALLEPARVKGTAEPVLGVGDAERDTLRNQLLAQLVEPLWEVASTKLTGLRSTIIQATDAGARRHPRPASVPVGHDVGRAQSVLDPLGPGLRLGNLGQVHLDLAVGNMV